MWKIVIEYSSQRSETVTNAVYHRRSFTSSSLTRPTVATVRQ